MKDVEENLERIKVLQYLYGGIDLGGAETIIVNLQRELMKYNCRFDYIVFEDREYYYSDTVNSLESSVIPIDGSSRCIIIKLFLRWKNLYKILKSGDYDVFHCNCDTSYRFVELALAKRAGVPVRIVHSHNCAIDSYNFKWKIKKFCHLICRKLLVRYATDFFACSKKAAEWMYGNNVDKEQVKFIANGIDVDRFSYTKVKRKKYREQLGLSNDEIVICNVGRFYEVKNQSFLLEIVKTAIENGDKVKLFLVGDGKLKETLYIRTRELEIEAYVVYTGNVHDVEKYLIASDVYIMPSLFEGLPVSGVEAQCAGLPLIASENVSMELNLTGHCQFVPLRKTPYEWWNISKKSLLSESEREKMYMAIDNAGFGIKTTAYLINEAYRNVR